MTQTEQIIQHLKSGRTLTALEARDLFQCLSLSQRVTPLIRAGYPIESKTIKTKTGKHIAQYSWKRNILWLFYWNCNCYISTNREAIEAFMNWMEPSGKIRKGNETSWVIPDVERAPGYAGIPLNLGDKIEYGSAGTN